jgi:hypothetical protein
MKIHTRWGTKDLETTLPINAAQFLVYDPFPQNHSVGEK